MNGLVDDVFGSNKPHTEIHKDITGEYKRGITLVVDKQYIEKSPIRYENQNLQFPNGHSTRHFRHTHNRSAKTDSGIVRK